MQASTHIEQIRRDDLEALGYVLMYFNRGNLPWQGLEINSNKEKWEKIMKKKMSTPIEELCKGFPCEFVTYLNYCRNLRFMDCPDYAYLRKLLKSLFWAEGYQHDFVFDWTTLNDQGGKEDSNQKTKEDSSRKTNEVHVEIPQQIMVH